ncbi:MAG: GFA family protein [bacterium]|nr:GFA family protein [bacterium]MDE0239501.1 GFA family protein [bacterium]MDE0417264.1 GFA family protein [bacterium]
MLLEGSCHCGAIRFRVRSAHPYPFNLCYCNICRKTGGGGGYAINLGAEYESLEVEGDDNRSVYHAVMREDGGEEISPAERSFCALCGTSLWLWDPRWPDLVHPLASAIDTELPAPPERTHLLLSDKPAWVEVHLGPKDLQFDGYPEESLAEWHERLGLSCPD